VIGSPIGAILILLSIVVFYTRMHKQINPTEDILYPIRILSAGVCIWICAWHIFNCEAGIAGNIAGHYR
jgi:hypothetical protein